MVKTGDDGRLYRIGEAADALQVRTCTLRFWETEFPQLRPVRTPKGQRLYTEEHMALLRRIHALIHEQGMTLPGARRVLEEGATLSGPCGPDLLRDTLGELRDIRRLLASDLVREQL